MKAAYYLIESDPALSLVRKHIADRQKVLDSILEMCKELGVEQYTTDRLSGRITGVVFPNGKTPEGWNKPKRGSTISHPRRGSPWALRFLQAPDHNDPSGDVAMSFNVPAVINSHNAAGDRRSMRLGSPLTECGWLYLSEDGPFGLWIPDVQKAVEEEEARGMTVDSNTKKFSMVIPGCKRIEEEEWEILRLKHSLAEKKRIDA